MSGYSSILRSSILGFASEVVGPTQFGSAFHGGKTAFALSNRGSPLKENRGNRGNRGNGGNRGRIFFKYFSNKKQFFCIWELGASR